MKKHKLKNHEAPAYISACMLNTYYHIEVALRTSAAVLFVPLHEVRSATSNTKYKVFNL